VVTSAGGAAEYMIWIQKANAAFIQLAREICVATKMKILINNVESVLLSWCETWKITSGITRDLQIFINRCCMKNLRSFVETFSLMQNCEGMHKRSQWYFKTNCGSGSKLDVTLRKDSCAIGKQ
jgi:hypothetical protein